MFSTQDLTFTSSITIFEEILKEGVLKTHKANRIILHEKETVKFKTDI